MPASNDQPLSIDCACRECGYNLRGLRRYDFCPECAYPVELALKLRPKPPRATAIDRMVIVIVLLAVAASIAHKIFQYTWLNRRSTMPPPRWLLGESWQVLQMAALLLIFVWLLASDFARERAYGWAFLLGLVLLFMMCV